MMRPTLHAVWLIVVAWLVLGSAGTAAEKVVMEKTAPGVIDRLVVLGGPWDHAAAEAVLRKFYLSSRGRYTLFRLTVAPTEQDAYRAVRHGTNTATYEYTVAELKRVGLPVGPVGQVLGVGTSAVMLFREGERHSKYILGDGLDPTVFHVRGGHVFRLLAFWLTVSRQTNPTLYSLTLSVKGNEPISLSACAALTEKLCRMTEVRPIAVDIRPDEWFMESTGFPALYPFTTQLRIPTESEYRLAPNVICGDANERGMTCAGQSFRP